MLQPRLVLEDRDLPWVVIGDGPQGAVADLVEDALLVVRSRLQEGSILCKAEAELVMVAQDAGEADVRRGPGCAHLNDVARVEMAPRCGPAEALRRLGKSPQMLDRHAGHLRVGAVRLVGFELAAHLSDGLGEQWQLLAAGDVDPASLHEL